MTHYDRLEVSHKASPEVIKAAYKSLMQRNHPDKNPDYKEAGERSALITQAYDVLSDTNRRTAYDLSISAATQLHASTHARGDSQTRPPASRRAESNTAGDRPYLHFWTVIVATILFSGGISLYLLKNQSSGKAPATAPSAGINLADSKPQSNQNETMVEGYGQNQRREDSGLTVRLPSVITVRLKDGLAPQDSSLPTLPAEKRRFLHVPTIVVQIGPSDSIEFARHIEKNKLSINEKLEERLADANTDELLKTSGELYLRKFLLDAIQSIAGTSGLDTDPAPVRASSGHYGAIGILLPESFSLK